MTHATQQRELIGAAGFGAPSNLEHEDARLQQAQHYGVLADLT